MSDFLSGLLDRTLDRAPVLDRRPASLFEPTPDLGRLQVLSLANLWHGEMKGTEVTQEVYSASDPDWVDVRLAPAHPHENALPVTSVLEMNLRESLRPAKFRAQTAFRGNNPTDEIRNETVAPPQERPHSKGVTTTTPSRNIEASSGSVREKEVEALRPPMRATKPEVRKSEPATAVGSQLAPTARSMVTPKIKPAQSTDTTVRRGVSRRPDAEPFAIKPAKPAAQSVFPPPIHAGLMRSRPQPTIVKETPHAPPAIQVTIGRIEVRGTPPAAPTRSPRAVTPKLNLEDYLRSREGKAR